MVLVELGFPYDETLIQINSPPKSLSIKPLL